MECPSGSKFTYVSICYLVNLIYFLRDISLLFHIIFPTESATTVDIINILIYLFL